jgi:uncharacterized protein
MRHSRRRLWKIIAASLAIMLIFSSLRAPLAVNARLAHAPMACSGLFFSEYIEGSSNNKALEIYNGTGAAVDLTGYAIDIYFNGSSTASLTIGLSGSVTNGDVFVVAQSSANAAILAQADLTNGSGWYNGNDTIVLRQSSTIIDVIGQIGVDPGTEWGTGLISTADNTLQRKSTVSTGDANSADAFDPPVQWDGYATDTFTGLGAHTSSCNGGGVSLSISDVTVIEGNSGTTNATFTVSLSAPAPGGGVTFDIATADNSATTANNDYVAQSLTGQTIAEGIQTYTFNVTVNGDTSNESNETYFVNVTNITGATGADTQGVGTITNDDGVTFTAIHTIQGSGATSSLDGSAVTIQGVVTADFQDTTTGMGGFFLQEEDAEADADPLTSEGIWVYDNGFGVSVAVGDVVRVTGTVLEYSSSGIYLTEISPVTAVTVAGSGASVTPVTVTLPVSAQSDLERYEGMRVTIPQTLTAVDNYPLGRYGEIGLAVNGRLFNPTSITTPGAAAIALQASNDLRRIVLDDGISTQNPATAAYPAPGLSPTNTLRVGDTVTNLAGVLDQRYGAYCLQPIGPVSFTKTNPRPATPPVVGGTVKVASTNLLNYFTTIDDGSNGARGADSTAEFTRQRTKTITVLLTLNADVVGLMELENNASAAIQDLVSGLNAIAGPGTYAYINTGVLGSDAIRVALIYKPGTVTPVNAYMTDLDAVFSRPPLAQAFQEISTGQRFSVVVNHFKSKGCSGATGLDTDQGDGQGCYNDRRTQQAAQLITFIESTVISTSSDSDVIIIGDLNSYAKEDPIGVLVTGGFLNTVNFFGGSGAYSYLFDGQSGYLDHALVNINLLPQVSGVAAWHVNADEPIDLDYDDDVLTSGESAADYNQPGLYDPGPFRAADHDPVLIGLNLAAISADYTDLADSYSVAWHRAPHNIYLGASVTDDASFAAGSDDASDDGVTRVSGRWQPDQTVTLNAQVTGGSGWLTGWFDWNFDGDFDDANEKAINQAVTAGTNAINVIVLHTAAISSGVTTTLASRFRLYESPIEPAHPTVPNTAISNGSTIGGEVEDYAWGFTPTAVELSNVTARSTSVNPWVMLLPLGIGVALVGWWSYRRRRVA